MGNGWTEAEAQGEVVNELALFGVDLFGVPIEPPSRGPVADKYKFPPFSILDARQGEWQKRKRAWMGMGIKGEVGRNSIVYKDTATAPDYYKKKLGIGDKGTSIFDPVLCELAYRWWCGEGGQVIDPFAGGVVRGAVAVALGLNYWGCDLNAKQIDANIAQSASMAINQMPQWVCGDSMEMLGNAPMADFIFSCPPYGNLEKYSNHPNDLSNMEWHTFLPAYKRIILRAVNRLRDDSFACFVVGDFRGKDGFYRNFVSHTIDGFESVGAKLYNEGVLVTPAGSASMRVTHHFRAGRKLEKTHQNILVFCKGDWKKASAKCRKAEE